MLIESVPIILDKERHLKLTLGAMVKFKQVTGKDLLKGFDTLGSEEVQALLWACLVHEDKTLTLDQVGDMVSLSNIPAIAEAIARAWSTAIPEAGQTGNPPQAQP